MDTLNVLEKRKRQILNAGYDVKVIECEKQSVEGSVSQRACVFCGSRVVLYPIADALHIVHGPVGCASYTWDIRGALSSGPELHRLSFSTDLREMDIIFGGEKKLESFLNELIEKYQPAAAFVYATCIIGIIGDDVDSVCRKVSGLKKIPVISVHSEGFKGTKKDGYKAACDALFKLTGHKNDKSISSLSINILGEFNLAGEALIIKNYYESLGIQVVSVMTGNSRIGDIQKAHQASLNVVQCSGSMTYLAKQMEDVYGIPYLRVSYFGFEDMAQALYDVAFHFGCREVILKTRNLVKTEIEAVEKSLIPYRNALSGKKAGIYVGGAFKAFSLIKALRYLNMRVVIAGSQTGNKDDYERLINLCDPETIILDDSNPNELAKFALEKKSGCFYRRGERKADCL